MAKLLPTDRLDEFGRQDPEAEGHVAQPCEVNEGEKVLENPVAKQLDARVAVKGSPPKPARGGDDTRGALALLSNELMHFVGIGFQIAAHNDDVAAAGGLKRVAQSPAEEREALIKNNHKFAQLFLKLADQSH